MGRRAIWERDEVHAGEKIAPTADGSTASRHTTLADTAAVNAAAGEATYPFVERRKKPRTNASTPSRLFGSEDKASFFYGYQDESYKPAILSSAATLPPKAEDAGIRSRDTERRTAVESTATDMAENKEPERIVPIWLR